MHQSAGRAHVHFKVVKCVNDVVCECGCNTLPFFPFSCKSCVARRCNENKRENICGERTPLTVFFLSPHPPKQSPYNFRLTAGKGVTPLPCTHPPSRSITRTIPRARLEFSDFCDGF